MAAFFRSGIRGRRVSASDPLSLWRGGWKNARPVAECWNLMEPDYGALSPVIFRLVGAIAGVGNGVSKTLTEASTANCATRTSGLHVGFGRGCRWNWSIGSRLDNDRHCGRYHSTIENCIIRELMSLGGQPVRHEHSLSNEWLAVRLMAGRKRRQLRQKRVQSRSNSGDKDDSNVFTRVDELPASPTLSQPPPSQPLLGSLRPATPEEEKLVTVLARPDLLITRNIEWANLAFGFEQQNRYVMIDPRQPQSPVGYILEDSAWFMRQLLRTRRSFIASVLDGNGVELFRIRRPMWLINSTIYVEVDGKVIGEARRRWHLWRRVYDLYIGNKQFATVENPGFWYWTFSLKDKDGKLLAEIDRNWRGFGFEFFTDAGQYVIRFGDVIEDVNEAQRFTHLSPGQQLGPTPMGQSGVVLRTEETQVEPLVVDHSLNLSERAMTLALAVSLDNDYFSRHSGSFGGFHLPYFGSSEFADQGSSVSGEESDARATGVDGAAKSSDSLDGDEISGLHGRFSDVNDQSGLHHVHDQVRLQDDQDQHGFKDGQKAGGFQDVPDQVGIQDDQDRHGFKDGQDAGGFGGFQDIHDQAGFQGYQDGQGFKDGQGAGGFGDFQDVHDQPGFQDYQDGHAFKEGQDAGGFGGLQDVFRDIFGGDGDSDGDDD